MTNTVLVIGGGGREHALAWKLSQSAHVSKVFVAPGNAGTQSCGKISNVALNVNDFETVFGWCRQNTVSLVVVGPEDPLAQGISDYLNNAGIPCFGPSAKAACIEASKNFAKQFMRRHDIPTAKFQSFTDTEEAIKYINSADHAALVVKASGLAAGKGVVVADTRSEACQAVRQMLQDKVHGRAGETVVVEELLKGEEVSCLAFTDGSTILCLPPAQDHKRLKDGDKGPNTGGMGAYCPYTKISDKDLETIKKDILQRTVDGLKAEGIPYKGLLYAGIMLTNDGPKTLEFNCRFGDPETQVILPLLSSDLYSLCKACVEGTLSHQTLDYDPQRKALGVVVVSGGYPGPYRKNLLITGFDEVSREGLVVFHAGTAGKDGQVLTSGGRVLLVLAIEKDFVSAAKKAQKGAALVCFDGAFYRRDIGYKVLTRSINGNGLTYKDAGVDIRAGSRLVDHIGPLAKSTSRPGCDVALGMFGGLFDCKAAGYKDPILVSGTDGVGTKLKIAHAVGRHETIGIDLVAMCVNDILAHGAEPLFFLDYFACGKLSIDVARDVVSGVVEGCKQAGCALLGGETAEMPGMYNGGEYDVAGFAVGAVERRELMPHLSDITPGDVVIGVASSGLHSNGFSLVRRLVEKLDLQYDSPSPFHTGNTLGHDLLTPTRVYVKSLLPVLRQGKVKAFAHITGGGLLENIPRVLPEDLSVDLNANNWSILPVFGWLADKGSLEETELARTFNCGLGGVLIVACDQADDVLRQAIAANEQAFIIGSVVRKSGEERVRISNLRSALDKTWPTAQGMSIASEKALPRRKKKQVAVLISGSGTNLQALIDYTKDPRNDSMADVVLVISNKAGVGGLTRAEHAGIPNKVINHKNYGSREEFDRAIDATLKDAGIEIVCLAGFMRILSGEFVRKWKGCILNVHPSLLPSFKGGNAHRDVLAAGVRISGCTVHFVAEEVDAGAILIQESMPVYPGDTESTLVERVKTLEHKAFPRALELVASERALLQPDNTIAWTV